MILRSEKIAYKNGDGKYFYRQVLFLRVKALLLVNKLLLTFSKKKDLVCITLLAISIF